MMVGGTLSGKTTVIDILARAITKVNQLEIEKNFVQDD
jgi:hypothetical protein